MPPMKPSAEERVAYIEDAELKILSAAQRQAAINLVAFAYRDGFAAALAMLREPSAELAEAAARQMEVEGTDTPPAEAAEGWQTWLDQARAALSAAADVLKQKE